MRCVDCIYHKAFPTTNIHWCEATKKHKRISDEDAYVDAPCKVADRKTENCSEKPNNCEELDAYRKCVESRSFWDNKHCDGCYFDERCPFDEPKDEPFDKDTNVRSKAVYDKWGNVFDARADIEDEPQTEVDWKQRLCDMYGADRKSFDEAWKKYEADKIEDEPQTERSE